MGSISRCLALAQELRRRGHEAFFLANSKSAGMVERYGFPCMQGAMPKPSGAFHPMHDLADVAVYLGLTHEDYIRDALRHEWSAVVETRPDVLVSEFKLTAPMTAAKAGIPLVSTACSPALPGFVSPLYKNEPRIEHAQALKGFNRVLSELRQEPIEAVSELFFGRSQVKLAPTSPALEPLLTEVPGLWFIGYLLHEEMENQPLPGELLVRAAGRDLVFVYLSSGEIGPRLYTDVIPKAFSGSGFHLAVATGEHPDLPNLPRSDDTVSYYRFLPGMSMLKSSLAMICHGGQNSMVSAMLAGVPSLVFPGGDFERYFNAYKAQELGCARLLPARDFTPEGLLNHMRDLLASSCALKAGEHGLELQKLGGAEKGADLVIQAAG